MCNSAIVLIFLVAVTQASYDVSNPVEKLHYTLELIMHNLLVQSKSYNTLIEVRAAYLKLDVLAIELQANHSQNSLIHAWKNTTGSCRVSVDATLLIVDGLKMELGNCGKTEKQEAYVWLEHFRYMNELTRHVLFTSKDIFTARKLLNEVGAGIGYLTEKLDSWLTKMNNTKCPAQVQEKIKKAFNDARGICMGPTAA